MVLLAPFREDNNLVAFDLFALMLVGLAFAMGGLVKGLIGFGMPTVAIGVLTLFIDLKTAVALFFIPAIIANFLQAIDGKNFYVVFKRIKTYLLCSAIAVFLGVHLLATADPYLVKAILACLLIAYGVAGLKNITLTVQPKQELWLTPVVAGLSGTLAGITGSFAVPGIFYIKAFGLKRDDFIQATGIIFTCLAIVLTIALIKTGLLSLEITTLSFYAMLPTTVGMMIGRYIRQKSDAQKFDTIFYVMTIVLGILLWVQIFWG